MAAAGGTSLGGARGTGGTTMCILGGVFGEGPGGACAAAPDPALARLTPSSRPGGEGESGSSEALCLADSRHRASLPQNSQTFSTQS